MMQEAGSPGLCVFVPGAMDDRDEIFELRRSKLELLRRRSVDPYPARFSRTHLSSEVLSDFSEHAPALKVSVAGRMGVRRGHGGMSFVHLHDGGGRIQIQFRRDVLGQETYGLLDLLAHGDFVGVSGEVIRTRSGEVT